MFDYSKNDWLFNQLPLASDRLCVFIRLNWIAWIWHLCANIYLIPLTTSVGSTETWTVSSTNVKDSNEYRAGGLGPVQTLLHMATLHVTPSLMKQNLSTMSTVMQMTRHSACMNILQSMFRPICYMNFLQQNSRQDEVVQLFLGYAPAGSEWASKFLWDPRIGLGCTSRHFAECFQLFRLST